MRLRVAGHGAAGVGRDAVGAGRAVAERGAAARVRGRGGRPAAGARARPARPLREGPRRTYARALALPLPLLHNTGHYT